MKSYIVQNVSVDIFAETGSRGRLRIPSIGTTATNMVPGDRVAINQKGQTVVITKNSSGNHLVERDGAIRFNASKYGLGKRVSIKADLINNKVYCW